jgi:hypothetical protein
VATTGSGSKADSAIVAIRTMNNYKSGSADTATTGSRKRVDSVIVTIGNHKVDSANVAIRINNRKSGR